MKRKLRIAIADDELDMREYLMEVLPALGHEVVAVAKTGRQLVDECRATQPDLVITDIKMPEMDGIEASGAINRDKAVPIILVSAYRDADLIERAESDYVLAYLVKPVKEADLEPAIALAMRRFEQFQDLRKEAADLKQALADRKVIERAKGVLMKLGNLDEAAAFRSLKKTANDQNKRLVDVAEMIIAVEKSIHRSPNVAKEALGVTTPDRTINVETKRALAEQGARVRDACAERLRSAPYSSLKQVTCDVVDGVLILRGVVRKYHLKQVALSLVASLDGVETISNQIEVRSLEPQAGDSERGHDVLSGHEVPEGTRRPSTTS